MNIILYNNRYAKIGLNKSQFLDNPITLSGSLRDSTSILSPTIRVQSSGLINSNYAYIPEFKRYYFIDNIVSFRTGIWDISMSVDVLMSFKDEIGNLAGIIARQEFLFNPYIMDNELPLSSERGIDLTFGKFNVNCPLFYDAIQNNEVHCFAVTVYSGVQAYKSGNNDTSNVNRNFNPDNLKVSAHLAMSPYTAGSQVYALTYSQLMSLLKELTEFDFGAIIFNNKSQYILGIQLFPYDLSNRQSERNTFPIVINRRNAKTEGVTLYPGEASNYSDNVGNILDIDVIDVNPYYANIGENKNLFLDYYPYSETQLFLPYYGFIDIDLKLFTGDEHYLWVSLAVDYITGKATYFIYKGYSSDDDRYSQRTLITTVQFQLGIPVPFGGNTTAEWYNNIILSSVGAVLSTVSMGAGAAGMSISLASRRGKISKKADAVAGAQSIQGSAGIVGSYIDSVTQPIQHIPIQCSGGDFTSFMLPNCPFIYQNYVKHLEPARYANLVGRPLMQYKELSTLRGFTVVEDIHISDIPTATNYELSEIESILKTGILL